MQKFSMFNKVTAKPGQRDAVARNLLEAARLVSSAKGCDLYVVNTSDAEPDAVWVYEVWHTEADHASSLKLPGVPELIDRTRRMIAGFESMRLTAAGGHGVSAAG